MGASLLASLQERLARLSATQQRRSLFHYLPVIPRHPPFFVIVDRKVSLVSTCKRWQSGCSRSVELSEEEADAHLDIAIDFGLSSGGGHKVSAGQAFVKSNTAHVDLLTFQRSGE